MSYARQRRYARMTGNRRTGHVARGSSRGPAPTLQSQLGDDLLYQTQVAAPGPYTELDSSGNVARLTDWTRRGAHLTPFYGNGAIRYSANGGPNDQPYAYDSTDVYDFMFGSIATIPDASRVEFYAVVRPAEGGTPFYIQRTSDSAYPFAASSDTDIYLDAWPSGGALQEIAVSAVGTWELYSVAYLAAGLEARVNGVLADPDFTGSGTCRGGACEYALLVGGAGDQFAFSCAVLNPSATTRAIVNAYVTDVYGIEISS